MHGLEVSIGPLPRLHSAPAGKEVPRIRRTQRDLVRAAAAEDAEAWDELVEQFAQVVWNVARAHLLDTTRAAEVSRITWLRLADHLDGLDRPERVGAWLVMTARQESLRIQ